MRGEYLGENSGGSYTVELPPRARRIHICFAGPLVVGGTTSACAENTGVRPGKILRTGNYLRVRGEYC